MRNFLFFAFALSLFISCKKGFILKSSSIKDTSTNISTNATLSYQLITNAFYKGKQIEPSLVIWTVKDANHSVSDILKCDTKTMSWIPAQPGSYTIYADATFDTKGKDVLSKTFEVYVYPDFIFLKSKIVGNYKNDDATNPNYKLDLNIKSDFTFSASSDLNSNYSRAVFYNAKNNFIDCAFNITKINDNGKLEGIITLHDSITNNIRTDFIRELAFADGYYTISFKQLYATDTTKFRFFELTRK